MAVFGWLQRSQQDGAGQRSTTTRGSTGGEGTLTQWVHYEFIVSFEAICPVITQQVCGEFF